MGYLFAIPMPGWIGIAQKWGVAGLTISAGIAGWIEFALLRWALDQRIGWTGMERTYLAKLYSLALCAAAIGFAVKLATIGYGPRISGLAVISVYGGLYLLGAWVLRISEMTVFIDLISRRLGGRTSAR